MKVGQPKDAEGAKRGTKLARGANFQCLLSGTPIASDHIYTEANAGLMGARMMAIVAEGDRGRVYLAPTPDHEATAKKAKPGWKPEIAMPENPRWFSPPLYGLKTYADLSDYFYVWLRRSLKSTFPDLFATLAVPKAEELVATPYRHGSKEKAESFFLDGMTQAMHRLAEQAHPAFPATIYYAFKQSESETDEGTASTGWETFLTAVIEASLAVSGTWPMRTERTQGLKGLTNALASSIILVCRKRPANAPVATRREFVAALKTELPQALAHLQRGNIAPGDLAQSAIGPGMAVFTFYSRVLDAQSKAMSVREALAPSTGPSTRFSPNRRGTSAPTPGGVVLVRAARFLRGRVRRRRDPLQGEEHERRRHGRSGHPRLQGGQGPPPQAG